MPLQLAQMHHSWDDIKDAGYYDEAVAHGKLSGAPVCPQACGGPATDHAEESEPLQAIAELTCTEVHKRQTGKHVSSGGSSSIDIRYEGLHA